MDAQVKKRRTLDAVKRILLRESLNQPLIVMFEDLHWIDEQTQEFLNLLADSLANSKSPVGQIKPSSHGVASTSGRARFGNQVWLKAADPCVTRERIVATDHDREIHAEVLRSWHAVFGEGEKLISEVIAEVHGASPDDETPRALKLRALNQALLMVAANYNESGTVDLWRLGHWFSSKKDRIVDGFRLNAVRKVQRATLWKVSCVSCVSSKTASPNGAKHAQSAVADDSVRASPASERAETNSPNSPNSHSDAEDEGPIA
jgi:hypothetical protein